MKRHPVARVVTALRAFVQAAEAQAYWNYWPLADEPRPVALTDKNRAPMDREWRAADPKGWERYRRGRRALRALDGQKRGRRGGTAGRDMRHGAAEDVRLNHGGARSAAGGGGRR